MKWIAGSPGIVDTDSIQQVDAHCKDEMVGSVTL